MKKIQGNLQQSNIAHDEVEKVKSDIFNTNTTILQAIDKANTKSTEYSNLAKTTKKTIDDAKDTIKKTSDKFLSQKNKIAVETAKVAENEKKISNVEQVNFLNFNF